MSSFDPQFSFETLLCIQAYEEHQLLDYCKRITKRNANGPLAQRVIINRGLKHKPYKGGHQVELRKWLRIIISDYLNRSTKR